VLGQGAGTVGGYKSLILTGSNFISGIGVSDVTFSGTGINVQGVTVNSANQMTIQVEIDSDAYPHQGSTRTVTVVNKDFGIGTSTGIFAVNTRPDITGINPSERGQGGQDVSVNILGSNFKSDITKDDVWFSGSGVTVDTVTFIAVDGSSITVKIDITANASTTTPRTVYVKNPDEGLHSIGGVNGFSVNLKPTVTSCDPSALGAGASGQPMTVSGSGFVTGCDVYFSVNSNGEPRDTTIQIGGVDGSDDSLSLTDVMVYSTAPAGGRYMVVVNGDGGRDVSDNAIFNVNQAPSIESVLPNQIGQKASGIVITISGQNFQEEIGLSDVVFEPATKITKNSVQRTDAQTVVVNVTIAEDAPVGLRDVKITNPDKGSDTETGGLEIIPRPKFSYASPDEAGQGAENKTITINGSDFQTGMKVYFGGSGITPNPANATGNSTQMSVTVSISSTADAPSARWVKVENTDSGYSIFYSTFTINLSPSITQLAPDNRGQGAEAQDILIQGSYFQNGITPSDIVFSHGGGGISVTDVFYHGTSSITARINVSPTCTAMTGDITVTNPDDGVKTKAGAFTVNAKPVVTSCDPAVRGQDLSSQEIIINGSGFNVAGSVPRDVSFGTTSIRTTSVEYLSDTQLRCYVNIYSTAGAQSYNVTVTNPDGGKGTGNGIFTVTDKPEITSLNFSERGQGAQNQDIRIYGNNFQAGSTVTFSGTGINYASTTFISAGELQVIVSIDYDATLSDRDVSILNPDGGNHTLSAGFTVGDNPVTSVAAPWKSRHNETLTVSSGTVTTDGQDVFLSLKRLSDGKWYKEGSGFTESSEEWIETDYDAGASTWSYTLPALTDGTSYYIRRYGYGQNAGREQVPAGLTFTYDETTGLVDNRLNSIYGTASSDTDYVELCIKDITRGTTYWNGGAWISNGSDYYFNINDPTPVNWSYSFSTENWTNGHEYNVKARPTDIAGNQTPPSAGKSFTIDYEIPVSTVSTPAAGTYNNLAAISGPLADAPDTGQVVDVEIYIQRKYDSYYFDGSDWYDTIRWIDATSFDQNSWSYTVPSPTNTFTDQYSNDNYEIKVRAKDKASNLECSDDGTSKTKKVTITWDRTPPQTSITFPAESATINYSTLTLKGACSDLNAVDWIKISIKNTDANQWYTGVGWTGSEQWVSSDDFADFEVYTTSWSYSGISWNSGSYNIKTKGAGRNCGNAGSRTEF